MQCSFCYGHGHNRMGCPKAKELADAALPQWEAWKKMEHDRSYYTDSAWRAGEHFDWSYQTKGAMEIWKKKQKRSKVEKTCNFCHETGHNKRTCSYLNSAKEKLQLAEHAHRASVIAALKSTGQGIGAMVSGEREAWCENSRAWTLKSDVGLIVGHNWSKLELIRVSDHGRVDINNCTSDSFLKVRWSNGQTEWVSSIGEAVLCGVPLLYRGWQVAKLSIASKSDKLMIPEEYLSAQLDAGLMKGRKAQDKRHFDFIIHEKLKDLIQIGQKMTSTS